MEDQKVIYISGPITGVTDYKIIFEMAEEILTKLGYIPLSPAHLPKGLTNEAYMRIDFAMIDSADAVLFLPGHEKSQGAMLELNYCTYTDKPIAFMKDMIDVNDLEEMGSFNYYLWKAIEE